MNLVQNWDKIKNRYDEFWAKENHDRPIMFVTAPKDNIDYSKAPLMPENIESRWLDFKNVVARARFHLENNYYAGEAFPYYMPNLGPDIFGAILGCDLIFGEHTSWSEPMVNDWREFKITAQAENNKWYKKIVELTELAVADAKGDYMVGITDLHAGADALVSIRGPENLCMDTYDCPESIYRLPIDIWPVMKNVYNDLVAKTNKNLSGTTTWMPCYHPGKWYVTSCDFICMISPDMFDSFILPELLLETDFFDANLFHLDGPGAVKHIDKLLSIPKINGIQWVPGAGEPLISEWKDLLLKIQRAGKCLHLSVYPNEVAKLAEYLAPEGVMLYVYCQNQYEADEVIKAAEKIRWGK